MPHGGPTRVKLATKNLSSCLRARGALERVGAFHGGTSAGKPPSPGPRQRTGDPRHRGAGRARGLRVFGGNLMGGGSRPVSRLLHMCRAMLGAVAIMGLGTGGVHAQLSLVPKPAAVKQAKRTVVSHSKRTVVKRAAVKRAAANPVLDRQTPATQTVAAPATAKPTAVKP